MEVPLPPTQQPVVTSQPQKGLPIKPVIVVALVFIAILATLSLTIFLLKVRKPLEETNPPSVPSPTPRAIAEDTFDGTVMGGKWSVDYIGGVYKVKIEEGKLVMQIPGESKETTVAIVTLDGIFKDYFESSVDVELGESDVGATTSFVFHDKVEGWPNQLGIYLVKETSEETLARVYSVFDGQEKELAATSIPSDINTIRLTIIRSSDGVAFNINGNLLARELGVYTGEGVISIAIASETPTFPSVTSFFDNFTFRQTQE